jgi:hypothetical protein
VIDDASGRFDVFRPREPGAPAWVHRWMGDDFPHTRGENSRTCQCRPHYIAADDKRSLDEIADDIEDDEESNLQ